MIVLGRIDLADLGINPVRAVVGDSIFWSLAWLAAGIIGFMVQAAESEYVFGSATHETRLVNGPALVVMVVKTR
jgi:hypothetical protein